MARSRTVSNAVTGRSGVLRQEHAADMDFGGAQLIRAAGVHQMTRRPHMVDPEASGLFVIRALRLYQRAQVVDRRHNERPDRDWRPQAVELRQYVPVSGGVKIECEAHFLVAFPSPALIEVTTSSRRLTTSARNARPAAGSLTAASSASTRLRSAAVARLTFDSPV